MTHMPKPHLGSATDFLVNGGLSKHGTNFLSDLEQSVNAVLDVATAADFRANTEDKYLTTDAVWGGSELLNLGDKTGNLELDFGAFVNAVEFRATGNITLTAPVNVKVNQSGTIVFLQDGSGGHSLSFNGVGEGWITESGHDLTPVQSANARTIYAFAVPFIASQVYIRKTHTFGLAWAT